MCVNETTPKLPRSNAQTRGAVGDVNKASTLLTTFKTSGIDFGARWDDIAILLDGDTITAKQVIKAFDNGNTYVPNLHSRAAS